MNATPPPIERAAQERLYAEAAADYAPAIARLARAMERDAERSRDLEQDIHLALWRSLAAYDGRCSIGTWTYRVAHNVAATHAVRGARSGPLVALEEADSLAALDNPETEAGNAQLMDRVQTLIARLGPTDRSVILLYLEGLEAGMIGQITGLSPNHVAVKVHRIKALLSRHFAHGDPE